MAALVAGRDANVGLTRFTWAVHDTTHHCHLQRQLLVGERFLRALGDLDDVDLRTTTTRAGDEVDVLALAQTKRLKQLATSTSFFNGVSGEAVANGVANALEQERGDARRRLDQTARQRPGLSHTEMERMIGDRAEFAIRLNHERHVRGLDRNLDEVETHFVEVAHFCLC